MMLRTTVRDCLYLNWALPADGLPKPPAPLRYQCHSWQGRDFVFASALLFHQEAVHLTSLPLLRFRYPQLTLRVCVLDEEGVPAVLFRRMLIPAWVIAPVWLVTQQPVSWGRLEFPHPSRGGDGPWHWRAERGGALEVEARLGSPMVGEGPLLGGWEQVVRYFEERPRGYAEGPGALHRIEARQPQAAPPWPLRAEVAGNGMLPRLFSLAAREPWPALHSAWLCPEMSTVFDLGIVPKVAASTATVPHPEPAAGRVVSPAWRSEALRPGDRREIPAPERRRVAC